MSSTFALRRAPVPSPPATRGLRVAVGLCAVAGVAALGAAGLLSVPATLLLPLVVAGAAAAPARWPDPPGAWWRKAAAAVVLASAGVGALLVTRGFESSTTLAELPADLGPRLALLVVGVLVAQLLLGERQREVLVALLVAATMVVLALAGGPGPAVVVPLLVAFPALVAAVGLAQAGSARDRADVVAVPSAAPGSAGPVARGPLGATVLVAGVVAVLTALLAPHPQGLQQALGAAGGPDSAAPTGGAAERSALAYAYGDLDLRARGSLPDTPVADVPASSPALWRGSVLDLYDGATWRATTSLGRSPIPGGPTYDLPREGPVPRAAPARTDRVRVREGFSGVLLAPGSPYRVVVAAPVLPLPGGGYLFGAAVTGYEVSTVAAADDPALLRAAAGPAPVDGWAGSLPPSVTTRVRDLSHRLLADRPSRLDQVRAVERYLRTHATYRLDSPVPPRGQDAVDHFLFDARTGFCAQFASAEVVLLRAGGVPARLATGFARGRAGGDHRTLLSSDAHAWAEVYFPGLGWVPSDPTAGVPLADSTARDRVTDVLRHARGRLLLAGGLVAALLLGRGLVLLGRLVRRGRAARRATTPRSPLLAAYDRFEQALGRAGAPRAPAETLAALGRRPAGAAGVAGALGVVERASYSARPPDDAEARAAAQVLDAAVAALDDGPTAASGARPRRRRRG